MRVRPARSEDCKVILDLYAEFTGEANTLTKDNFVGYLSELNNAHQLYVVETLEGVVVGCATLLIEHKLIHNSSSVAHVEDVIVAATHRGQGYGHRLITALVSAAKKNGCYKIILDCADEVRPFYESCGFQQKNIQMAVYFS